MLDPIRILVVDDHPFSRLGVVVGLEQAGYEILEADNEQTALDIARCNCLHAAVLDIVIPPLPGDVRNADATYGVRLGQRLRERFPDIGIVFISSFFEYAHDVFELVVQGQCGIAYLHKTSSRDKLLDAIRRVMAGELIIESGVLSDVDPLVDALHKSLTSDELPWVDNACQLLENGVLTRRENEVAALLASARSRTGIRHSLHIEEDTIDTHITNIPTFRTLNSHQITFLNQRAE